MTASTAKALTLHEWAVAVDTVLADLWDATEKARYYRRSSIESLHRAVGHVQTHGRFPCWYKSRADRTVVTGDDAINEAKGILANPEAFKPWTVSDVKDTLDRVAEFGAEIDALRSAAEEFEAEWDDLRWSRFFLVKNNNGHIHSSTACSTCFPTTVFGWLPDLSGLTEKDAVDAHGTILCSICFPTAPVEWTLGKQRDTSKDCDTSGKTISQVFGTWEDAKPHFRYSGRGGYIIGACPGKCGQTGVAVTSTFKVRKHQKKET